MTQDPAAIAGKLSVAQKRAMRDGNVEGIAPWCPSAVIGAFRKSGLVNLAGAWTPFGKLVRQAIIEEARPW